MSEQKQNISSAEAVAEGGAYELIRSRLERQGQALAEQAGSLNQQRLAHFGSTEMALIDNARIRTENNCVPRDIVHVQGNLLFGYNVFVGLRRETAIEDVFSLHVLEQKGTGLQLQERSLAGSYMDDGRFQEDFRELYHYYREARLTHLRVLDSKLLAVFRTGQGRSDIRVFRWSLSSDRVEYLDNRGERDYTFPASHDFEWISTTRSDHISGFHPHINILDQVFVETLGGTLTIKVEDNTQTGEGIYSEAVEDASQSLADAQIAYARMGDVILLKVRPYRESLWRYLVFNTRNHQVNRIDAIGQACRQLPEDHGLIFPGGYYLQSGESKTFEVEIENLEFQRVLRSPNGEDVLYIFHHYEEGRLELLSYNLIRKELQNPITCHGHSLFADGRLVVFRYASEEPTRVHPMQIWQTPYVSEEVAAQAPSDGSFLARTGNAELVRGISEALTIARLIDQAQPTMGVYEALIKATQQMLDAHHWLADEAAGNPAAILQEIKATGELILNEFEKVEAMRQQADSALQKAEQQQKERVERLQPQSWQAIEQYVEALSGLRTQRGHLISLQERRYIDRTRLDALEQQAVDRFEDISQRTVTFLLGEEALEPYHNRLNQHDQAIDALTKEIEVVPLELAMDQLGEGLDLLNEILGGLKVEDATQRTSILERISEVYARLNRAKASLSLRHRELRSHESAAAFGAEFKLYGQSVTSALALADSPEKCDQQLTRLLLQLEELEARFGEFDEYLEQLTEQREEVYQAFESRKQGLVERRQRRGQQLGQAANRILQGVARRAERFQSADELHAYFASDPMVLKLRELSQELRTLGDSVRADDIEARLKAGLDQSTRTLRDKDALFEDKGAVIRLGRHRFSVNTQALELSLLPLEQGMALHLSGTDFMQPVQDPTLESTRAYWPQIRVSENAEVYRSEYLAACLLFDAEAGDNELDLDILHRAARREGGLLELLRTYAETRYDEGYDRGVHDVDAAAILAQLLSLYDTAGVLRYTPHARGWACLFWLYSGDCDQTKRSNSGVERGTWCRRARSLGYLAEHYGTGYAQRELADELAQAIGKFLQSQGLSAEPETLVAAGAYLVEELAQEPVRFHLSAAALQWVNRLQRELASFGQRDTLTEDLKALKGDLRSQVRLARAWLEAPLSEAKNSEEDYAWSKPSAVSRLVAGEALHWEQSNARLRGTVEGLLGQHPRIQNRQLNLRVDEMLHRLRHFRTVHVPGYQQYRQVRQRILEQERKAMRLEEFQPKPLSTFVRNRLIDEVYLPLVGDNLAKQMGALGSDKRSDLMGLLLLISPPGYGKTTLMEYIAHRMGLIFMKINAPVLGHQVTSLDPNEAPNSTARQEVTKLNLALEMGNNVMLYVDDIQHSSPEFLQKFISLADAQRKMEGIWRDQTRTYDLRGKRFCVVMAGNPYTESGDRFQIPDMLANRADIYNLGDVLSGREDLFALSYLENCLTSNPVLAPLATRELEDLYRFIKMAKGQPIAADELSYAYNAAQRQEIISVLKHLLTVRDVLLDVNRCYIQSASQQEAYRSEPPFKLQGSYRNMNKIAEKIVAVMNKDERAALISDHYTGEAQTLTAGAEENLLKLAQIRGVQSPDQQARWDAIRKRYGHIQAGGGADADPATRIVMQLTALGDQLGGIREQLIRKPKEDNQAKILQAMLESIAERFQMEVQVVNQPLPGISEVINQLSRMLEDTLLPMLSAMQHKLTLDHAIWDRLGEVEETLKSVDKQLLSQGNVVKRKFKAKKSE